MNLEKLEEVPCIFSFTSSGLGLCTTWLVEMARQGTGSWIQAVVNPFEGRRGLRSPGRGAGPSTPQGAKSESSSYELLPLYLKYSPSWGRLRKRWDCSYKSLQRQFGFIPDHGIEPALVPLMVDLWKDSDDGRPPNGLLCCQSQHPPEPHLRTESFSGRSTPT